MASAEPTLPTVEEILPQSTATSFTPPWVMSTSGNPAAARHAPLEASWSAAFDDQSGVVSSVHLELSYDSGCTDGAGAVTASGVVEVTTGALGSDIEGTCLLRTSAAKL